MAERDENGLSIEPAILKDLAVSTLSGYLLGKYLSRVPWNVLDTFATLAVILLTLRTVISKGRTSLDETVALSDEAQLERNATLRRRIGQSVYQRTFTALLGSLIGLGMGWNSWDVIVIFLAVLGFGLSLWALRQAPRRRSLGQDVLEHGKVAKVDLVVETPLASPSKKIQEYWVFIRGENLSQAGLSNWRALMLEPIPSALTELVNRNVQAQTWFTKRGMPVLIKYDGVLVELTQAETVLNRWSGR
jgi:hypothetical protein